MGLEPKTRTVLVTGIGMIFEVCAFIVGIAALCTSWVNYTVSNTYLVGANQHDLFVQWPQLFFSRWRYLDRVCFPTVDDYTWLNVFHEPFQYDYTNNYHNGYYYGTTMRRAQDCMWDYESPRPPINVSAIIPSAAPTSIQQKYLSYYSSCLYTVRVMLILDVIFTAFAGIMSWTLCQDRFSACYIASCVAKGFMHILTLIFIIVAAVLFYKADALEPNITQPPHYGFVLTDKELVAVTTKSSYDNGIGLMWATLTFNILAASVMLVGVVLNAYSGSYTVL